MNDLSAKPTTKDFREYRAEVVSIDDPKALLMVQIRLIGLWDAVPDADLPWAEIKWPIGTRAGEGLFMPVQVGDKVWVDFINGDSRYPRITGGCHHAPAGVIDLPENILAGKSLLFALYGFTFEVSPEKVLKVSVADTEDLIELSPEGFTLNADKPIHVTGKDKVLVKSDVQVDVDAPKVNIGDPSSLEPSVLGDKLAAEVKKIKQYAENHKHQDSLGIPTTPALTLTGPLEVTPALSGGAVYSKNNKNS